MPSASPRSPAAPRWLWALAVTFAGYLAFARLGLLLAIPPGIASPLWPAAGLALVTALVWGRWALLGAALGSMVGNLASVAGANPATAVDVGVAAAIGTGVALQAWIGVWLVRRYVAEPLLLTEPSELLRFVLLAALLACCVSPSVGVAALWTAGRVAVDQIPLQWGAWWIGDALGVLIFSPVMLALIGQPRSEWAARRWPVALPMLIVTLLMGLGIREVIQLDVARQRQAFEREAGNAANAVRARLAQPLQALEAMRGLVSEVPDLKRDAFRRASAPWLLGEGGLRALGWNERVARADFAAFEARERASGIDGFRVFDRQDAGSAALLADQDAHVIRFIEPLAANAQALGVNVKSIALARAAMAQAARSGSPVVSTGFELTQGGLGVVIYQAVYSGSPATAVERGPALRGLVFATLSPSELLRAASANILPSLKLCLLDNDAPRASRVLAGPPGCDALASATQLHVAPLALAGRQWDLRVYVDGPVAPGAASSWPFALFGLLASAMLGALLLVVTGRARRIEAAVRQRTTELQAEVAERQRTSAALNDSQQRLRNILNHVPIGVIYTDAHGRIREVNPKLCDMLGMSAARLVSSPIADLLHPDDRPAEAQARARLLSAEVPMARWQSRCLTGDGRTVWTQVGVSLLRDAQDQPTRMVWVMEDITEHLALEDAQRARRGAEAANLAKNEFLSRMSHELRTPLNAMLGFSQLLDLDRRQPLAPHQLEWTGQIRQAGWHLLHMINDTLDLARIESGHIELDPRPLDVAEQVSAAVGLLTQNADKHGVRLDVRLPEYASSIIADPTRLTQILTNLISNAIKYNVEGGRVTVHSRLAGDNMVAIDVTDTGRGMTPVQLAQLFQPFNRLGLESGPIEGTGIGLVISLRLAELMGGSLHARSTLGQGSTFTLELPRASRAEVPTPSAFADDEELPMASYRQRVVHYVEDNETNVEVMRGIMVLRPQVTLEVSTLGLDGLAAIRARRPSLILLDMHLPDIDGLELLRHLQADESTSDIPVIVVSADATSARIGEAIAAGATHYLTKPINVPQFLAALDEVLEQLDTLFG